MKRRDVLTALGSGGAVGLGGYFIAGSRADEELQRRVSLASQDSVADKHELTIDAKVVESTITNMQTAQLEITTTNEGPDRAIGIGTDGCTWFSRSDGGSDDPAGLWLHSPEQARDIDRKDNRWVRAPSEQERGYTLYGCHPKDYNAGGSLNNEYVVWDDYSENGYLNPGTYRWEENVSIWEGEYDADEEYSTIPWGFSLTIENAD